MTTTTDFFRRLNMHISGSQTKKTLIILEKMGRNYVNNLPSTTDKRIKRHAKMQLRKSLIKINRKRKTIKTA